MLLAITVLRELGEHSTDLSFAKTEIAQGGEGLCLCLGHSRLGHLPVLAAISVPEANTRGDAAGDDELTAVRRSVMCAAQSDEVVGFVATPLGAELEVVKVKKQRVSATWNAAAVVVAAQYRSARRWRDGLLGASASAHVGAVVRGDALVRDGSIEHTDVLTVAVGHRYDLRIGTSSPLACWLPLPHSGQTESAT